jgi:Icc-related predicted phosphoesterase
MRVHVVSDVHGNAEALARAGEGADALIVLGDLLDFVDYHAHDRGILGTLFGAENVGKFARLRREGTREETVAFSRSLWASLDDPGAAVEEAIREQYSGLFAAMTAPTYAMPGNVDTPDLWAEFAGRGVTLVDGEVVEIGGLRFGFGRGVPADESGVAPLPAHARRVRQRAGRPGEGRGAVHARAARLPRVDLRRRRSAP